MEQSIKKLYYSIGEVSEITGLKPYVLRYWETEFKQLSPPKNRAGNRTFRQKDIKMIQSLKQLLHVEKFTIEGARKRLAEKPAEQVEIETAPVDSQKQTDVSPEDKSEASRRRKKMLGYIRQELESMLEVLQR